MVAAAAGNYYKKRLEGVELTDDLRTLYEKAVGIHNNETFQTFPSKEAIALPIAVVRAMRDVLDEDSKALEAALKRTKLVFTPPPPSEEELMKNGTQQQKRFYTRMQRLRFRYEETKYAKLTQNLGKVQQDDDVTTKSMTYAASIGLNMIVAPISFGVFMYFFAGSLLSYAWPTTNSNSNIDIRRVILGVISGVVMLFIEMLLFVIRTNEMDKAMRRKQRKNKPAGPFSNYTSSSKRTYQDKEK